MHASEMSFINNSLKISLPLPILSSLIIIIIIIIIIIEKCLDHLNFEIR